MPPPTSNTTGSTDTATMPSTTSVKLCCTTVGRQKHTEVTTATRVQHVRSSLTNSLPCLAEPHARPCGHSCTQVCMQVSISPLPPSTPTWQVAKEEACSQEQHSPHQRPDHVVHGKPTHMTRSSNQHKTLTRPGTNPRSIDSGDLKLARCGNSIHHLHATASHHLHATAPHSLAVRHAANAGHKRRKGAHNGHKACQNHSLAAILGVEGLRLVNVLLLEHLLVQR